MFRYYVLVAASILARKAEWLKNACLAAALLIPAVAALHGIVLAVLHDKGEFNWQIYGPLRSYVTGTFSPKSRHLTQAPV